MSEININEVLTQMKGFSIESLSQPKEASGSGLDFSAMLKSSLDSVNETQQTSAKLSKAFEVGDSEVSLAEVMIASQKAGVAFQATLQVRNKLVDAYKELFASDKA